MVLMNCMTGLDAEGGWRLVFASRVLIRTAIGLLGGVVGVDISVSVVLVVCISVLCSSELNEAKSESSSSLGSLCS